MTAATRDPARPVVLLDLDGVLADLHTPLRRRVEEIAEEHGFAHEFPDPITDWRIAAHHPATDKAVHAVFREAGFFASLDPMPGAVDAVHELRRRREDVDVLFCSSPYVSNPIGASDQFDWVQRHFGRWAGSRLILTGDKTLLHGHVLVDDRPDVTGRVAEPAWRQVLYTHAYNTDQPGQRIDRWDTDAVELICTVAHEQRDAQQYWATAGSKRLRPGERQARERVLARRKDRA
ncbi:MAG: 5' nucleotidase, NT5C type [Microbacteriaceae bacterium]